MAHHRTILFLAASALLLIMLPLSDGGAAAPAPIGMPSCETRCGNKIVPYPFGMGPSYCYMPGFNLTCDLSSKPPRLLLADGTLQVLEDIDPSYNILFVAYTGEIKTDHAGRGRLGGGLRDDGPYALYQPNELILLGCNVRATLKNGNITMSSCSSFCKNGRPSYLPSWQDSNMPCSGMGCCQAPIVVNREVIAGTGELVAITSYDLELESFGWNHNETQQWPAHVFVAMEGWFTPWGTSQTLLPKNSNQVGKESTSMLVPIVLDWEIFEGHGEVMPFLAAPVHCPSEAASRVCKSNHSRCDTGERGGYACSCKDGYQGNPYITNGCQDIDECEHSERNGCFGQCTNVDGSFWCHCPQGTSGDPFKPGGCFSSLTGDCIELCGNISVPYPFGIGLASCYLPGFNLTCDTSHGTRRLMLGTFRVVDIDLCNNTLRVINNDPVLQLYGGETRHMVSFESTGGGEAPYSLSTNNELVLIGCGVQAGLYGASGNRAILSGCSSFCSLNKNRTYDDAVVATTSDNNDDDQYCYGMGCCQTHISMSRDGMPSAFWISWTHSSSLWDETWPRSYTFIAEVGWFHKRRVFAQLQQRWSAKPNDPAPVLGIPIVLEWEVLQLQPASGSWPQANTSSKQYLKCPGICRSKNSLCKPRRRGYTCHCIDGYYGNPYLINGCTGGPKSIKGMNVVIGVASGFGIVLLVLGAFLISNKLKHRRARTMKRKFFEQNRGQLLEQLVSQKADITERMIFSVEELEKATNNFDKARELGGGGHGTVYKGILSDLHVVAIKKPKKVVQKDQEIREFINEVAILSQINHRNVVKLYGCCLETEVPILIYEFICNGTLYEHLHAEGPKSLFWDDRLRIATEAAKSLAYLHSASSTPIIDRDVKSANILLDDTLTAKVADFGASRYIPMDLSGITTRAQGTRGYWDPTYFYTGRLTEKSDVYSFGVVLVELLTREKPFSYLSTEDESLVAHFAALFERGQLLQILDPQVIEEGGTQVEEVASIAVACIKLGREDRPTMRQVELMLEGTRASMGQTSDNASPSRKVESNTRGSIRRYSMELEFRLSAEHPR